MTTPTTPYHVMRAQLSITDDELRQRFDQLDKLHDRVRQLERQLAAVTAERDALRKQLSDMEGEL